jgi:transcription elongation factor
MLSRQRMDEQNIIYRLLFNSTVSSQQPKILSAFTRPSLPGKIYVEAKSERDVCEACRAQTNIFIRDIVRVPIEEAVSLLTLSVSFFNPQVGSWVRIASGLYRGDLAYVLAVKSHISAKVALVPRLQLERKKRKAAAWKNRPPKRLFDQDGIANAYGPDSVEKCNQCWKFQKEIYKNGLLEKQFILEDFVQELAIPTVAELLEFQASGGVRLNDLSGAFNQISNSSLRPGDRVEVTWGRWAGVIGEVHAVSAAIIQVLPSGMGASENVIDVPAVHITRHFRPGDFVKVRSGREIGKTGWVVSCNNSVVTFHEPSSTEVNSFLFIIPISLPSRVF